jgi:diguanylate cyclase (GGDEF)-like protein
MSGNDTLDLVKLSFFVEMGKAISCATTIDETLQEVMRQIGQIFAPLNWSLMLRDSRTGNLNFTIVVGESSTKLQGRWLPKGKGIAGWIAERGEPVIVADVQSDQRFFPMIDTYTGFRTQSIIGVPLKSKGKVFGVIELVNKINDQAFTPFDLKVLTTIADFAAIAIEKAYYNRALKRLASVDPLTGVFNRGEFQRIIAKELERSKRQHTPLACLLVDVDDFKNINDTHGHVAGDNVLKSLAAILGENLRKVDSVCRYGGDEFVVVMPGTNEEQAATVRTRILEGIEFHNQVTASIPFTASIGLHATQGAVGDGFFELLDKDLYREKERKLFQTIEDVDTNIHHLLEEEKNAPLDELHDLPTDLIRDDDVC